MRRFLALLPIVAIVVGANALVASAGIDAAPPPTPSTTAYTVVFAEPRSGATTDDTATSSSTTDETAAPAAPAEDTGVLQAPDLSGDGVTPAQADCFGQLATIDLTTGELTVLPAPPSQEACAGDLTFGPDGTLYGLVGSGLGQDAITELVRFDTTTGEATPIGQIGTFSSIGGFNEVPVGGLTFDAQGHLFVELLVADAVGTDAACLGDAALAFCLYRIDDPNNPAAATLIGQTLTGDSPTTVFAVSTLNASCTTMYAGGVITSEQQQSAVIQTIDPATGAATTIGQLRDEHFLAGQATDRAGTLWALELVSSLGAGYDLATLDPAGGTPIDTEVGGVVFPGDLEILNGLAIEPLACATPEPVVLQPTFTG